MFPTASPATPPASRRASIRLKPDLWSLPPYRALGVPHLFEQGWPIQRDPLDFEAMARAMARQAGVDFEQLRGSRIGGWWAFRAVLLAIGEDVLLTPTVQSAWQLELTTPAANRLVTRARLGLHQSARLRAELRPAVLQVLGFRIPEPNRRPLRALAGPC